MSAEPFEIEGYALEFKSLHEDAGAVVVTAQGPTLLSALAALESELMEAYGAAACLSEDMVFCRDIGELFIGPIEIGESCKFYDFSAPEDAFEITRLNHEP